MGVYGQAAVPLAKVGLSPIPVGGEDGKTPLIKWRGTRGVREAGATALAQKFPGENVGILTGVRSKVSVVDVDEAGLLDTMLARCGDSPLITKTPSGGFHAYYRFNGERNVNRLDGLKVDIRGEGGFVLAPPSRRSDGRPYAFERGSWSDLGKLPNVVPASLPDHPDRAGGGQSLVYKGQRNSFLHRALLREALAVDSFDDLLDCAHTINGDCVPQLEDYKVVKAARSAWKMTLEGNNWCGGPPRGTFIMEDLERLGGDPYAFTFLAKLRLLWGGLNKPFPLDARAMREADTMPGWSRNRYLDVIKTLLAFGYLLRVYRGGKYKGDASLYLIRS